MERETTRGHRAAEHHNAKVAVGGQALLQAPFASEVGFDDLANRNNLLVVREAAFWNMCRQVRRLKKHEGVVRFQYPSEQGPLAFDSGVFGVPQNTFR